PAYLWFCDFCTSWIDPVKESRENSSHTSRVWALPCRLVGGRMALPLFDSRSGPCRQRHSAYDSFQAGTRIGLDAGFGKSTGSFRSCLARARFRLSAVDESASHAPPTDLWRYIYGCVLRVFGRRILDTSIVQTSSKLHRRNFYSFCSFRAGCLDVIRAAGEVGRDARSPDRTNSAVCLVAAPRIEKSGEIAIYIVRSGAFC